MAEAERSALRRTRFGFVFQFGQLVPELTAEENVALPLLLDGVGRREALEPGPRLVRPPRPRRRSSGRRSGELSGGAGATGRPRPRAWWHEPEVVFADEPTGSLDSLAGEQVMELLVGAARDHGTTVVLVTHDARVAAYADREIVVRDGRVATPVGMAR